MLNDYLKTNNLINSKNLILIYNILRDLGLNTTLKGTKLLNKSIQIVINSEVEFIVLENVYNKLALKCVGFNSAQIRNSIKYAIDTRKEEKSKVNFENIFGYQYDSYYFTNKTLIEEIARVVKYKNSIIMHYSKICR